MWIRCDDDVRSSPPGRIAFDFTQAPGARCASPGLLSRLPPGESRMAATTGCIPAASAGRLTSVQTALTRALPIWEAGFRVAYFSCGSIVQARAAKDASLKRVHRFVDLVEAVNGEEQVVHLIHLDGSAQHLVQIE